jgi:uncharacterized protein (DUF58 family)
MKNSQLAALVAHLKIIAHRLTSADMSGDFSSAFRGGGLEFAHIRNYELGDEVRSIDWKSSAKMNRLMVKEFVQERERTVIIVLDISASLAAGSREDLKHHSARTVAACLTLMAQNTNDKVGLILYADTVVCSLPPKKGKGYSAQLVHTILTTPQAPDLTPSNMNAALTHLAALNLRNAIVFLVSDWIVPTQDYGALLAYVGRKNETVAVRITDPVERELPAIGVLPLYDPETGITTLVSTHRAQGKTIQTLLEKRRHDQKQLLKKHSIALMDIDLDCSLVTALAHFFHSRAH